MASHLTDAAPKINITSAKEGSIWKSRLEAANPRVLAGKQELAKLKVPGIRPPKQLAFDRRWAGKSPFRKSPEDRDADSTGVASRGSDLDASGNSVRLPGELAIFTSERFDPQAYIAQVLGPLDEQDVRAHYHSLLQQKDSSARDLQANVHRHYEHFVLISHELQNLQSEMGQLRVLMNEMKEIKASWAPGESKDGRRSEPGSRSSKETVAKGSDDIGTDQRGRELLEHVEGYQRYVTPHEAQTILYDTSSFVELEPANLRFKQAVHVFLFQEVIFFAVRKKRAMASRVRLIADKALNLSDIAVMDIPDGSEVSNAFKILKYPDVHVFRCDTVHEKRSFLTTIKEAIDNLLMRRRRDNRMGINGVIAESNGFEGEQQPLTLHATGEEQEGTDSQQSPASEVISKLEELDVLVAHRKFDAAVSLIEQGRKAIESKDSKAPHSTNVRLRRLEKDLSHAVNTLTRTIERDLSRLHISRARAMRDVNWLKRLDIGERACQVFLDGRGALIKHRLRHIKASGDVAVYVTSLSSMVCSMVAKTSEWFQACFDRPEQLSALVRWARSQFVGLLNVVERQVFQSKQPFWIVMRSVRAVQESATTIGACGLDLAYLVQTELEKHYLEAIQTYEQESADGLADAVQTDSLVSYRDDTTHPLNVELEGANQKVSIAEFVLVFYDIVDTFMQATDDLRCFTSAITLIAGCVCSLFDAFANWLFQLLLDKSIADNRGIVLLSSLKVTNEFIFPPVSERVRTLAPGSEDLISDVSSSCAEVLKNAMAEWERLRGVFVITAVFRFRDRDFARTDPLTDDAEPSPEAVEVLAHLHSLKKSMSPDIEPKKRLANIIDHIFLMMTGRIEIQVDEEPMRQTYGAGGIQQLILDIHFLLKMLRNVVSTSVPSFGAEICENALRSFLTDSIDTTLLKPGEWYEERVDEAEKRQRALFPLFL